MILGVKVGAEDVTIDITDVGYESEYSTLAMAVKIKAAIYGEAVKAGVGADEIALNFLARRQGGDQLSFAIDTLPALVDQIAALIAFIEETRLPERAVYAYICVTHWQYVDFDDLSSIEGEYQKEFDGDYDEFARGHMESLGTALPWDLQQYFDYDEYGRDLIEESYSLLSFDDHEFIFDE